MVIFMAINHWSITAILAKKSIMAVMASVLKCQKYDLYGCLVKELSKCRSPVKTALKKMDPVKNDGPNKNKVEKMAILGRIPLKIGLILELMAFSNESL